MKKIRWIFIIMFFSYSFCAQNRIYDAGGWFSLGAGYKLNNKISFTVSSRIRQYDNFTRTNSWYIDLGQSFKIKDIRISVHYAFKPSRSMENYFRNIHKYYILFFKKYDINKYFSCMTRIILQHSTHRFITDFQDNGYLPYYRTDFRIRPGIRYHLSSRTYVYVQDEVMITLSRNPYEISRNRIYSGYTTKIFQNMQTEFYVVVHSSYHRRNKPNMTIFILGCDIIFDLN